MQLHVQPAMRMSQLCLFLEGNALLSHQQCSGRLRVPHQQQGWAVHQRLARVGQTRTPLNHLSWRHLRVFVKRVRL
jgi:hypothetical protein